METEEETANAVRNIPSMFNETEFPNLPLTQRKVDLPHIETSTNAQNVRENNSTEKNNARTKRSINDIEDTPKSEINDQTRDKRARTTKYRQYDTNSQGPFEVIVASKDNLTVNPFTVGKLLKNSSLNIKHIEKSFKKLIITCGTADAANKLLDYPQLANFKVFIPANRVEICGLVNVDPDVNHEELKEEAICKVKILDTFRLTKMIPNKGVVNTHWVKVTFSGNRLPQEIKFDYIILPVREYIPKVLICLRCFKFGHTMSKCQSTNRICGTCLENYHGLECDKPPTCLHCKGGHISNAKECPEYQRQGKIRERMGKYNESYLEAAKIFPKEQEGRGGTYANVAKHRPSQRNPATCDNCIHSFNHSNVYEALYNENIASEVEVYSTDMEKIVGKNRRYQQYNNHSPRGRKGEGKTNDESEWEGIENTVKSSQQYTTLHENMNIPAVDVKVLKQKMAEANFQLQLKKQLRETIKTLKEEDGSDEKDVSPIINLISECISSMFRSVYNTGNSAQTN